MLQFERQADGLRRISGSRGVKVIAVTSGKGGVGKTQIAVNLAVELASRGRSTLLLDADLGLANVDVMLGLKPEHNLEQVIDGDLALEDILVEGPAGLRIVPAASGVSRLANLSLHEQAGLVSAFSTLPIDIDVMVVDTATGADHSVLGFCSAASEVVVVICDEPASMTDGYALIKLLSRERGVRKFQILCNRVRNRMHGQSVFARFEAVCDEFLDVGLCHAGSIPEDPSFGIATSVRQALVERYPSSKAGIALKDLASRADKWNVTASSGERPLFFVERMLTAMSAAPSAEVC